jgi:hypothetical protein
MVRTLLRYLQRHHLALLALFLATGGTSYAAARLPANSVTTRQVKDFSLLRRDFKRGQLPRPTMGAVAGSATKPPAQPDRPWENLSATSSGSGKLFVQAHVDSATLTCGGGAPCSVDLGLYVDNQPVDHTDRVLTSDCSSGPCQIHVSQQDLFGIAPSVKSGPHRIQLCSKARTGTTVDLSEEGGELTAILLGSYGTLAQAS